jgi:DNA-binding transcriptional MerR regulator
MPPLPDYDQAPEKLYYPIGEVAEIFGVNASLIRFWEKEFEILKPHKNKKGNRLFTKTDLDNLKLIYHLVKEQGYTLEGARKILESRRQDAEMKMQITATLQRMKRFLEELKDQL